MGFSAKVLVLEISRAALGGDLELVGEKNVTGDAQKKLGVFGNQIVMDAFLKKSLEVAIASVEHDQVELIECCHLGQYIFCFHLGSDS